MLDKRQDWWSRLNNYIDECRGKSIDWDSFDCCQFICGCVKAMTDKDPYKEFAYKYNTKSLAIQAVRMFSTTGMYNKGIVEIVEKIGYKVGGKKVDSPQRGDIVVLDNGAGEYICGVVLINRVAVIDEKLGLQFVDLKQVDLKTIMRAGI